MPRGGAPRALLSVFALIFAVAVAAAPIVDARPKDKNNNPQNDVAAETVPADEPAQADPAPVAEAPADDGSGRKGDGGGNGGGQSEAPAPVVEEPLTTNGGNGGNERSLIQSDADGDYIPDSLDNCASIQNPDQSDADGDGHGDACPVYQDTDGDTVPDKQDNCPNVATSDYSDRDGDGVGDPCDKSPDGIEPEPEPVPELDGQGGEGDAEPPPPENGAGVNGDSVERDGRARSKQRERTDIAKPTITTGVDGGGDETAADGEGGPPAQTDPSAEEPVRDNPRRNEELLAEAAAAGEIFDPAPPPTPRRAWDEEAAGAVEWESVVRIDVGRIENAASQDQGAGDSEPNDAGGRTARGGGGGSGSGGNRGAGGGAQRVAQSGVDVADSEFARGYVRAKLLLQDELPSDEPSDNGAANGGDQRAGRAPVPVENGLVITGSQDDEERPRQRQIEGDASGSEAPPDEEVLDEPPPENDPEAGDDTAAPETAAPAQNDAADRNDRSPRRDGSRRNGSSRSAAASAPARANPRPATPADENPRAAAAPDRQADKQARQRARGSRRNGGAPASWSDDRYFSGGSALNWSGDIGIAGTDDDALYLTQRSGSGAGKRRGFEYAIPIDGGGVFLVRLYFAEPYWGAPGGPAGEDGRRVFSVIGEGQTVLDDLDVYAEAGALTALVKQGEVTIEDGELNLRFTASEGEPIVAAIEILQPAQ